MTFSKHVEKTRQRVDKLCSPSKLYLGLSLISIVFILTQNLYESTKYCIGMYSCSLDYSNIFVFIAKLIYVGVWTIVLDSLCKNDYKDIAWGLVLFPYVLMFVMIGYFVFSNMRK